MNITCAAKALFIGRASYWRLVALAFSLASTLGIFLFGLRFSGGI
jgi:hypothetical protein